MLGAIKRFFGSELPRIIVGISLLSPPLLSKR